MDNKCVVAYFTSYIPKPTYDNNTFHWHLSRAPLCIPHLCHHFESSATHLAHMGSVIKLTLVTVRDSGLSQ